MASSSRTLWWSKRRLSLSRLQSGAQGSCTISRQKLCVLVRGSRYFQNLKIKPPGKSQIQVWYDLVFSWFCCIIYYFSSIHHPKILLDLPIMRIFGRWTVQPHHIQPLCDNRIGILAFDRANFLQTKVHVVVSCVK